MYVGNEKIARIWLQKQRKKVEWIKYVQQDRLFTMKGIFTTSTHNKEDLNRCCFISPIKASF